MASAVLQYFSFGSPTIALVAQLTKCNKPSKLPYFKEWYEITPRRARGLYPEIQLLLLSDTFLAQLFTEEVKEMVQISNFSPRQSAIPPPLTRILPAKHPTGKVDDIPQNLVADAATVVSLPPSTNTNSRDLSPASSGFALPSSLQQPSLGKIDFDKLAALEFCLHVLQSSDHVKVTNTSLVDQCKTIMAKQEQT